MSKAQWQLEKGSPLTVAGAAPTSPRDRKTAKRGTGIPSWLLNLSSAPELSALKERALFLSRWSMSPVGHSCRFERALSTSALHPNSDLLLQRSELMLTRISSWTDSVRRLFKVLKTRRQIGQPLWRRCDQRRLDRLIKAG